MRRIAVIAAAALAVLVVAALVVFLWLRAYAPLGAVRPFTPGPGLASDVEPTFGSGGKTVLMPAYRAGRAFDTTFTLHNAGRFAVTLTGVDGESGPLAAQSLLQRAPVRIEAHTSALVGVRWRLACRPHTGQVSADTVRLRYRYLSLFRRTAAVELPFAVTLRCSEPAPTP